MNDNDAFHSVSMMMNINPEELAKIVDNYIESLDIVHGYYRLNCPKPPIYIGPVKIKTLKERLEETQMKATSVQSIENVKEMHFTIERSCIDEITKVIVGVSTNDDIFEFHFSGDGCVEFADQWFNMVAEKSYKTDFESERNKRKMMETENSILRRKIKELEKDLAIEKAANEAQHKFIREYAGKGTEVQFNYAIDDAKEVSYVIVDKEEYNKNFEKWANVQVENAPTSTSRADILDQAKKCVCGQREQDYGTPESNFQLIADLWNDYLKKERLGRSKAVVDRVDVAMMMALMKIARIRNGGGSGDSFVDLAGYAACGGEIWHEQKVKDQN